MTGLDLVLLLGIGIHTLNGLRLGFVQAFANFFGWALALFLAWRFVDDLAPSMHGLSDDPVMQSVWACAAIVTLVMIITWLLCSILSKLLHALQLGLVNRIAGAGFGLAKSLLVILILISVLNPILQRSSYWQNAVLVQSLLPYAPWANTMSKHVAQQAIEHIRSEKESSSGNGSDASDQPKPNPFY